MCSPLRAICEAHHTRTLPYFLKGPLPVRREVNLPGGDLPYFLNFEILAKLKKPDEFPNWELLNSESATPSCHSAAADHSPSTNFGQIEQITD